MATELPATTIATPDPTTTITPVIKRPIVGRIFDATAFIVLFLVEMLDALGQIDFTALGLSPTGAARAALAYTAVRFALAYRPVRLVDVKVEPAGGGQG